MELELTDKRLEPHFSFLDVLKNRKCILSADCRALRAEVPDCTTPGGVIHKDCRMKDVPGRCARTLPATAQATFTSALCEKLNSLGIRTALKGLFYAPAADESASRWQRGNWQ